jgi:hypothetical protein
MMEEEEEEENSYLINNTVSTSDFPTQGTIITMQELRFSQRWLFTVLSCRI